MIVQILYRRSRSKRATEYRVNAEEECEAPPEGAAEYYTNYSAQEKKVYTTLGGCGSNDLTIHSDISDWDCY